MSWTSIASFLQPGGDADDHAKAYLCLLPVNREVLFPVITIGKVLTWAFPLDWEDLGSLCCAAGLAFA